MTAEQPRSFHSAADARRFREAGLWGDELLVDVVDARAAEQPAKVALIDSRGVLTYGEVVERSRNLALSLLNLGVHRGDVVAIQSPNWTELPITHLALDRIGAMMLPLHDGFRDVELRHLLRQAGACAIIAPAMYRGHSHRELIRRVLPDVPGLRHIIVLRGDVEPGEHSWDRLAIETRWRDAETSAELGRVRPSPDDPLEIMVSSGTTALPKASLLSDNNSFVRLVHGYARHAVNLDPRDVAAALAPAGTGATGYTFPILTPLLVGATSVLLERWNGERPEDALDLMEEHQTTFAVVIPTQLAKLVAVAGIERRRLALRFVTNAGARLLEAVADATERSLRCRVQTIYGASDAAVPTMTTLADPRGKRHTTVGRLIPGQELRIIDDAGRPLPPGEAGEVCWRGAAKSYGYLNDPEGTRNVWDAEGWYHSGDLGEIDGDGYLRIVGRKKDMIIRGGRNINPRAIEEVLVDHPGVLDAAVVAMSDSVLGERVCAFVIPRDPAAPPLLGELTAMVRARGMAVWYQPEQLILVSDFPRNAGAKVDKGALAKLASSRPDSGLETEVDFRSRPPSV